MRCMQPAAPARACTLKQLRIGVSIHTDGMCQQALKAALKDGDRAHAPGRRWRCGPPRRLCMPSRPRRPPAAQAGRMQPCGRIAVSCLRRLAARPRARMPRKESRGQLRQPGRIDDSHLRASPSTHLRLLGPPRMGRKVRRKRQTRVDLGRRCLAPGEGTVGALAVHACPAG